MIARLLRIRAEVEEMFGELHEEREEAAHVVLEQGAANLRERHRLIQRRRARLLAGRHPDILPPCPEGCGRRLPSYKSERCAECARAHRKADRVRINAAYYRRVTQAKLAAEAAARPPKLCACGSPTPTRKHDYCPPCAKARELAVRRESWRRCKAERLPTLAARTAA